MLTFSYNILVPAIDLGDDMGQRRKLPLDNVAVRDLLLAIEGAIRQFLLVLRRALDKGVLPMLFNILQHSRVLGQFLLVLLRLQIV